MKDRGGVFAFQNPLRPEKKYPGIEAICGAELWFSVQGDNIPKSRVIKARQTCCIASTCGSRS